VGGLVAQCAAFGADRPLGVGADGCNAVWHSYTK
jgi:hypothetical protein